jgi:hypothetical protein
MDFHAEGRGAAGERLADPAHADDGEALAGQRAAEKVGRPPAGPAALADKALSFAEPPQRHQDEGHGDVGGVLGKDVGRVGDCDAAGARRLEVDIVRADAVIGDQLQPRARALDQLGVEAVADIGDEDVAAAHRLGETRLVEGAALPVELGPEERFEPRLHRARQGAGDDDLHVPQLDSRRRDGQAAWALKDASAPA